MDQLKSKPPSAQECCGICNGLGWFKAHSYDTFTTEEELLPCPLCNPMAPLGRFDKWLLGIFLLMVLGIAAIGAMGIFS